MHAIASSVSGFVESALLRLAASHRDADLLDQISPAMQRHLIVRGIARSAWTSILFLPLLFTFDRVVGPWLFGDHHGLSTMYYTVFGAAILIGGLLDWRRSALSVLDGEIQFYRLNRKWRWER